jgi:uncharacterized protein YdcH (DUF465 family)
MKIKLTQATRTELSALRAQLASLLEQNVTSNGEYSRLAEQQQKLEREIAALEKSGDLEDDATANKLATRRVQLEAVIKKITAADSVSGEARVADTDATLGLLRQFARAAAAATSQDIETYAAQIASKLRPYCQDDATARHIAFTTPAAKNLMQTYAYPFGSYGFSIREIKAAVARADEILSENLAWSFDAKN